VPGFIYPSINGVPEWTLYADGLLVFKTGNSSDLVQAHLSPANVHSILNVILYQDNFFASTRDFYGHLIPDTGSLLLNIDVNGQHKQVRLYGKPTTPADVQTRHVFAIKSFLFNYRPAATQPYIPPGIALIAIPQNGGNTAVQECPFLALNASTCPSVNGSKAGILAILGSRGRALLQQAHTVFYIRVKEQGKVYRLVTWPLLPDAFYPRKNGSLAIEVQGASKGIWPLLLDNKNKR
jgi:hypothetical protein